MRKSVKLLLYLLLTLAVIYLVFTIVAPPLVDKSKNKVSLQPPYNSSPKANVLIESMDFIGDLHCDALLWNRDLNRKSDYGHVDFPRMRESNVAFQAFTIVTKSPKGQNINENNGESLDMITPLCIGQGQPPKTWFSLINRALYQCKKLHRFAENSKEKVIVIKSKSDFVALMADRKSGVKTLGGLLGIEGGHCLEGELENLDRLYDAGVRMLGPAHFFDNEMGGSAHGLNQGGLSDFGIDIVKAMQNKGMILDVSHSSEKVIDDVLKIFNGPILSSHTGVDGTVPSSRNLSDNHLIQIAERDGLIGIGYFPTAIGPDGIKGIAKTMDYSKKLIGIEHIALGSDFDGSVTTPFDVRGIGLLVDELYRIGFSDSEIKAILGENLQRFLMESLPE